MTSTTHTPCPICKTALPEGMTEPEISGGICFQCGRQVAGGATGSPELRPMSPSDEHIQAASEPEPEPEAASPPALALNLKPLTPHGSAPTRVEQPPEPDLPPPAPALNLKPLAPSESTHSPSTPEPAAPSAPAPAAPAAPEPPQTQAPTIKPPTLTRPTGAPILKRPTSAPPPAPNPEPEPPAAAPLPDCIEVEEIEESEPPQPAPAPAAEAKPNLRLRRQSSIAHLEGPWFVQFVKKGLLGKKVSERGPFSWDELLCLSKDNMIDPKTMIRTEADSDYRQAGSVEELFTKSIMTIRQQNKKRK